MRYNVKRLIRERQLKRWSRAQLAAKCDRTENMIYKIEHGERASEKTIFAMSKALGVPMSEILIEVEGDGDAA